MSVSHKGLELYARKGDRSKLPQQHLTRIRLILTRLDAITAPVEMNQPGYHFHASSGDLNGFYSVNVFDPAHPGELIRETIEGIREETGEKLTIGEVAEGLGVTRKTLSAIINGKQSITPEMSLRLSTALANTTPQFWLNVQENYDLARARQKVDTAKVRVFWQPVS